MPIEQKHERFIKHLIKIDNKPDKLILDRDTRKVLWKILLHQSKFDDIVGPKIWLIASGAANMINMEYNRNYYFQMRDHNLEYPNPCFN